MIPMSKTKRYQVSLRTAPELISEVDARAKAYGVSRNQFINQAITAAIAASYARQALQPPTDGTVPEAPAKNIVVTEDENTHMGVRQDPGPTMEEEREAEEAQEAEEWGIVDDPDPRHLHRYNAEVPDSEYYVKGTRWVQQQCECGAVTAKRSPKKAM